jgi:hypothetical protein
MEDNPMARVMLLAPVFAGVADSVVVAPVSKPDMAAVISRDFILALVIGDFLSREVGIVMVIG